jgi:hypothetical protein
MFWYSFIILIANLQKIKKQRSVFLDKESGIRKERKPETVVYKNVGTAPLL